MGDIAIVVAPGLANESRQICEEGLRQHQCVKAFGQSLRGPNPATLAVARIGERGFAVFHTTDSSGLRKVEMGFKTRRARTHLAILHAAFEPPARSSRVGIRARALS